MSTIMDRLAQLEAYSNEVATTGKSLATYSRSTNVQQISHPPPLIPAEAHQDVYRAAESMLSNVAKIKTLLFGPTDFLKHLASQMEILACLRWLGEFQVLACIPLLGSVAIKDIAAISAVPETHLSRIIRLTATAGFLHESQPGHVAHTALSAPFVANPSFLDAAMFLAEWAAPSALQMGRATQQFGDSNRPNESAYNLILNTAQSFHAAREERPKLSRQWSAYLHHAGGLHTAHDVADMLAQLNWSNISNARACIVEVGAKSTSMARSLAEMHPALHFLVQITDYLSTTSDDDPLYCLSRQKDTPEPELSPRITVTNRTVGARQTATNAAVYILHLPSFSPSAILAELHVHLGILRASSSVMLILTVHLLPEPGSIPNPEIEAMARSRDLTLLQLTNEGEMEMVELLEMIDTVGDSMGKLVVTKKLHLHNHVVVALVVKYRPYAYADRGLEVRTVGM